MSRTPANHTFKLQQKTLVPSTYKRATISSININNRTANIYFSENPQTIIKNVIIANSINVSGLLPGMQVKVDAFNETSTTSMVISYVFGQGGLQPTTLVMTTIPANSSSTGTPGQIAWATGFLYICIAVNTWRRVALSTF